MDYSKLKIAELRVIAKEKGLRNIAVAKKKELVELLTNVDKMLNKDVPTKETAAKENAEIKTTDEDLAKPTVKRRGRPPKNKDKADDKEIKSVSSKEMAATSDKADKNTVEAADKISAKSDEKTVSKIEEGLKQKSEEKQAPKTEERQASETEEKIKTEVENKTFSQPNRSFQPKQQKRTDGQQMKDRNQQRNAAPIATQRNMRTPQAGQIIRTAQPKQQTEVQEGQEVQQLKVFDGQEYNPQLASDQQAYGILEVMPESFGFIRSDNYMPGDRDIYLSPAQIRKFGLKTGDVVRGPIKLKSQNNEKFSALLYIESVNGMFPSQIIGRKNFEDLTPIFPNDRIKLDYDNAPASLRMVDFFSPIGKGQRGMIVSPPKAGKTTLLKQIAKRISVAYPEMNLLVLLIDERPEEVTDIKESIEGPNAEVIYSTFDELPEHHKRVSEMVIERAKRLVESGKDVVILIDSITRLSRAYNLTVPPSGRTLSGGLDPAALHMPKKFFGAARNMREGGSLTILATALIETGSRMDDVVFEEFKGTGNMELVLNRELSNKRLFPAIDIVKSGTRKDDLLLDPDEQEALALVHQQLGGPKNDDITEEIIKLFSKTKNNKDFIFFINKMFGKGKR